MVSIHRPLGYEPNALPLRHFAYCCDSVFYKGLNPEICTEDSQLVAVDSIGYNNLTVRTMVLFVQ